jgi:uncharacterized protein (DUF1499 family)
LVMVRMRKQSGWVTAALSGLALAACGSGVEGITAPPPIDMTHLERPETPNTALAAPDGFKPTPDIVTPIYNRRADDLYAAVIEVARRQARTYLLKRYDDRRQAHFVARIAVFGFPDLIAVQVLEAGADRSRLVIWSRSVYGYSDFGVNRKRVARWLAAIDGNSP